MGKFYDRLESLSYTTGSGVRGASMSQAIPPERGTDADGDSSLSSDDVYGLLSNHRRRYALHYLKHRDSETSIGDLSEQVAAWENGIDSAEVGADQRKRVYTSLQQVHLPKLDEKEVVQYDDRAGTVELSSAAEDLDVYMEVVQGRDIPWSQYYLGLAAVNAGLVAAVFADAYPLTLLPDVAWAAFVVTSFVISALVHTYINSEMRLGERDHPPELDDARA